MKKVIILKTFSILILMLLLLAIPLQISFAAVTEAVDNKAADNEKKELLIDDRAELLSAGKADELNVIASNIEKKYQIQIMIITVDRMDGYDAYEAAKSIYTENELGYGSDKSGLLLFLSMYDRDYALIAHGYGNIAFTDHGKDVILDNNVLPLLADDNFYEAFSIYLEKAEEFLIMAANGEPFDVGNDPAILNTIKAVKLGFVILIPLALAAVICLRWRSKMKTAKTAKTADIYMPQDGFTLTHHSDLFLYRTQTTVKVKDSSSSSGGTTIGSGGFSGSSGKF